PSAAATKSPKRMPATAPTRDQAKIARTPQVRSPTVTSGAPRSAVVVAALTVRPGGHGGSRHEGRREPLGPRARGPGRWTSPPRPGRCGEDPTDGRTGTGR